MTAVTCVTAIYATATNMDDTSIAEVGIDNLRPTEMEAPWHNLCWWTCMPARLFSKNDTAVATDYLSVMATNA